MAQIGDIHGSDVESIEILKDDIGIFLNLIKEHKTPLDLVRELLSNAGAREVGAMHIDISYTKDREGHVFEIVDDGCGMNYTGDQRFPGRLDRFLGLGMSSISGKESDEFSWKGLGSKLAYQSRRVEVETRFSGHPEYNVRVNEPWSTLQRKLLPNPQLSRYPESARGTGTKIRVTGHPPHRQDRPFTVAEIRDYLVHRTFCGFTRQRDNPPQITLSVLGNQEIIAFGFPEFRGIEWPRGMVFEPGEKRLIVNVIKDWPSLGPVILKGFLTWDGNKYGLDKSGLNTGLILSARGIPYFELGMEEYGARSILRGYPGKGSTCLVVECDRMSTEMNIARSDLTDSAETVEFKKAVRSLLEQLETSSEYLEFRAIPAKVGRDKSADYLAEQKRIIESEDQNWVILQREDEPPTVLMREPKNEAEVNALIWKLEALGALPFYRFQSLGYVGAQRGPDLLANFQEDRDSEQSRTAAIEIENNFYSYKAHGHTPSQYPKVICWDAPTSGRKDRLQTVHDKKYKFTIIKSGYQVHVFVLKLMDGIHVVSRRELADMGIKL